MIRNLFADFGMKRPDEVVPPPLNATSSSSRSTARVSVDPDAHLALLPYVQYQSSNIERRQLAVPCGDDAESLAALLNQEDAAITTSNETKDDRELAREWSRAMDRAVTLPSAQDFTRVFDANILNVDQRPIRITFGRSAPEASLTSTISQQSSIMAASKTPGPSAIKIKLNVGGAGGPRAASFNLGVAPGRQASPERSGSRSEPNSPERARAHDTQGKRKTTTGSGKGESSSSSRKKKR